MELSLKIDLTDEQYKDLMTQSFQTISKTPEMTEEIRKTIVKNIGGYLLQHPEIIQTYLGITTSYYGRTELHNAEIAKKLVETGLKEYGEEISEVAKDAIKGMIKRVDFSKIFEHFFYKAMLNGFKESMTDEFERQDQLWAEQGHDINIIKGKLGID